MSGSNITPSGTWQCTYWYPSNIKPGTEEASEYTGTFKKSGKQYVYESHPKPSGDHMFVRMTIEDDLVTGTWHENTSPTGEFGGAIYSGAFQALISEAGDKIEGKWAGVGQDNGKRSIYTGRWLFKKVSD